MALRAGPIRLDYDSGDVRALRIGNLEIVRRIYVVFQDRNWTARPWMIDDEVFDVGDDAFQIQFTARGTFDAEPFRWHAHISGTSDGTVRYAFEGRPDQAFWRNRLGLCILHPIAGFAGRPCTITAPDQSSHLSVFPDRISPHQPFHDIAAMEFPATDNLTVRLALEGEVFETEDHRNWSDASYKTYCTPISLPFPVRVEAGDTIAQSVTVSLDGVAPPDVEAPEEVTITVDEECVPLPEIGTQITGTPWTIDEGAAIAALGLGHLMITIDLGESGAAQKLHAAAELAAATQTRLRVRLRDGDAHSYAALSDVVADISPTVDSWAILRSHEKVTSRESIDVARAILGEDLPYSAGTDLYFTELNREAPDASGLEWIAFSMNPQVHAFDDRTLMQNTATHGLIAEAARDLVDRNGPDESVRIAIGPITLRPRYNPNATDPSSDVSNTALPSSVDERQRDWRAAAWMALSLRTLAAVDAVDAVTYFEALGWRGLREWDAGSQDPDAFGSQPGEEFPVYRLLAALRAQAGVFPTKSDQPEVADALVTRGPDGGRAWLVNFDSAERSVRMTGVIESTIDLPPQSITVVDLQRSPE